MPESKRCVECDQPFTRPPGRSAAQWEAMRCCTLSCANTLRARGRERQPGDLDRSNGKQAYQLAWQRRRQMPAWAAWWEDQRRAQDLAEITAVIRGGPTCRISQAPRRRHFISGTCPDCNEMVTVIRGWWNGSIRCPPCTAKRWRQNHRKRARRYGIPYQHIAPVTIFQRDGWRCQICRRKTRGSHPHPRSPTLDHIIPLACGGTHTPENLQCACFQCNYTKGARAANDQLRLAL